MAAKLKGRQLATATGIAGGAAVAALAYVALFLPAAREVPRADFFGRWTLALAFTAVFSAFLLAFVVRPRARNWRELGASEAFFVALFTEMFGAPLTVYLLTALGAGAIPSVGPEGHLWASLASGSGPPPAEAVAAVMLASTALVAAGVLLVVFGWRAVHAAGEGVLVTHGLYRASRHPQYLGFLLVVFGFLLMWPTLLTLVMAPILAFVYVRLARCEDAELERAFGEAYREYAACVPFLLPRLGRPVKAAA